MTYDPHLRQPTGKIENRIFSVGSFSREGPYMSEFGWAYSFALKALQVIIARNANGVPIF